MSAVNSSTSRKDKRPDVRASARLSDYQQKRREQALEKQRSARRDFTNHARQLALQQADQQDDEMQEEKPPVEVRPGMLAEASSEGSQATAGRVQPVEGTKQYYAQQLMQPEWLTDIPCRLASDWYVMPRAEGRRCLVISSQGYTVSRLRNGSILHAFPSLLPNGSRRTGASADAFCILDCVYHEPNQTYYVMDLMCWKGYPLYDCAAEFRLFWLHSKLAETEAAGPAREQHRYPFVPVPAFHCNPAGLTSAHSGPVDFQRDGCYLLHKEGQYELGPSPLALLWKDAACSSFLVDTDASGVVPQYQQLVLEYRMDRTVATSDDPPVVLGRMPDAFVQSLGDKLRPGRLLRFSIREEGLQYVSGQVVGADLHFGGFGNQRRGRADACSKVVFQHQARHQPIQLQQLLHAAAVSEAESADIEAGAADPDSTATPAMMAIGE
ncbi:hypothetical protein WJX72_002173 [[Myrmecia] bisecta]|uniref:Snurportin-1 n=1 Tax=[Myrmecia] bisecta TaxID=41462 RepID=A0AAW1PJR9_9CHLO